MLTDLQLCNGGLSKISSSRINILTPPRTPLEQYMKVNYEHWKRTELAKRRWVFALVEEYDLTLNATLTDTDRPYKFALPNDCLRPIRNRYTPWVQRGRFVYASSETLKLDYIKNAPESDFDPLFNEVLMCKIGYEACEYVTQSTSKTEKAYKLYQEAVKDAGQANAFVIGPEDIAADDSNFSWLGAHDGYYTNG